MAKKKDLPASADANPREDHVRYKEQEEFDDKNEVIREETGRSERPAIDELEKESEEKVKRNMERGIDSQQGHESKLPETKRKQSPKDYYQGRKWPPIKK